MGHGPSSHEVLEISNPNNLPSKQVQFIIKAIKTLKMEKYHGWSGRCMGRWQEQSFIYQVLQTIQMKLILLCVWAEPAVLGRAKTALKFIYKIQIGYYS